MEKMEKMKKMICAVCAGALLAAGMTGCAKKEAQAGGAAGGEGAKKVQLKLSHPSAKGQNYDIGAELFKKLIEEKSGGKYEVAIFPANQLGTQEEVTDAAQMGTIDFVVTSDEQLSPLVADFGSLGMPFVFRDFEHVYKTVSGPIGEELSKKLEAKGVIVIAWLENGFRHITNNRKPITVPDDLKGIKIRTLATKPCIALFENCGATVASVSFSELYSALQMGTVEAQENPFPNIYDRKFYEVQKYLSISGHVHTVEPLIMSKATFNKLTPEEQKYFVEAGKEVTRQAFTDAAAAAANYQDLLKDKIQINEVDRNAFMAVSQKVYDAFPQYTELAARIKDVQ